jgi:hypothetical protein
MILELLIKNQLPFSVELASIFISMEQEIIIFRAVGSTNDRVVKFSELEWWKIR